MPEAFADADAADMLPMQGCTNSPTGSGAGAASSCGDHRLEAVVGHWVTAGCNKTSQQVRRGAAGGGGGGVGGGGSGFGKDDNSVSQMGVWWLVD
jgi:hypothetical protein